MPLISKPNYNQIFASQAPEQDKPAVFNNYPLGWGVESRPNNGKPTIKGFNFLQQTSDLKALWILQNGACLPYDESIEYAEGSPVLKDGVIQYKVGSGFKSRDSVTVPTYNSAADGVDPVTGVDEGAYFNVRSSSDESYIEEYQNIGGVPTPTGKSYPSGAAVQEIADYTALPFSSGKTYSLNERVQLENGDIVKSNIAGNTVDPNVNMTGWVLSGNTITVEAVADLIAINNPKDGQIVSVQGVRGGAFKFDSSLISVNNEGTVFNGWVRQYVGGVYAEWFGANSAIDNSPILEKALSVDLHVKFGSGDFIFESECGIPDTSENGFPNSADKKIIIEGGGSTRFLINSTDRPVFTSARSKGVNYHSRENLFSAKIDFINITMIGRDVNSKVFNGDRLYNTFVERCNFYAIGTVLKCDVVRDGEDAPYSQSFTFSSNHFVYCDAIARVPKLYNFVFSENMCEANPNGFILEGTTGIDSSIMSARFTNNLFEGGGIFIKCKIPQGLVVTGNYLEFNNMQSATDNLCQILIDGTAQATVISGNFIASNNQTPGYTEIKYINHYLKNHSGGPSTTGIPTITNNIGGVQLINYDAVAVMFGNAESETSANNSLRMTSPMEAYRHSSYFIKTYTASARNPETNRLTVGFLDLTRLELYYAELSGLLANLRIRICFGDGSNTNIGEFYADTSVIIYSSPYNSDGVIYARAKLNSFIDNNTLDFVTVGDNYAQNFGDNVNVVLTQDRKNVYKIELTEYYFSRNPQYFNISIDYDVFSTTPKNSYWSGGLIRMLYH